MQIKVKHMKEGEHTKVHFYMNDNQPCSIYCGMLTFRDYEWEVFKRFLRAGEALLDLSSSVEHRDISLEWEHDGK